MSSTENARNFRSVTGKSLPAVVADTGISPDAFAHSIAAALRCDFGDNPSSVKKVARLVHAKSRVDLAQRNCTHMICSIVKAPGKV